MKTISTFFILCSIILIHGCIGNNKKVKGNGNMVNSTRSIEAFNSIKVSGSFDVVLVNSNESKVEVYAESNILEHIITSVSDNTLFIQPENKISLNYDEVTVKVFYKEIENLNISGSASIISNNELNSDNLKVSIAGSGSVDLFVNINHLTCTVTGSGRLNLKGNSNVLTAKVTGSGDIDAEKLTCNKADVSVMGSGDINVYVNEEINARVTGSGDITYQGNPKSVNKKETGSGSIKSK